MIIDLHQLGKYNENLYLTISELNIIINKYDTVKRKSSFKYLILSVKRNKAQEQVLQTVIGGQIN